MLSQKLRYEVNCNIETTRSHSLYLITTLLILVPSPHSLPLFAFFLSLSFLSSVTLSFLLYISLSSLSHLSSDNIFHFFSLFLLLSTHLVDIDAVSTVEADLGGVPEPVAGGLWGGHNDTLDQDATVDNGNHLGLLLDRRGHWWTELRWVSF